MNEAEVVMNPVRQRIIQFLMVHERGTVKEIKSKLKDVPTPSLYRHEKFWQNTRLLLLQKKTG